MQIQEAIYNITKQTVERLILSRPLHKDQNPYKKVMIRPVLIKGQKHFQLEKFTQKQAFHENILPEALPEKLSDLFSNFGQLDGWTKEATILVRVNPKGNVLYRENPKAPTADNEEGDHEILFSQNREKNYLYDAKDTPQPLVDLKVVSKEGKIIRDQYAKFRQINRFVELIEDGLDKDVTHLNIIDFGCGKSYLTFVLYDYLTRVKKIDCHILGLDLKEEVIQECNWIAKKYNYTNLTFEVGDINGYEPKEKPDMVISLHACDTATDFALYNAISWGTHLIYSVPCCQHEVNGQLNKKSLGTISENGLLKERFAAILTDALRADLLRSCGYQTDVLEFIDMAFSPKNVMLRAVKTGKKSVSEKGRREAFARVEEAVKAYQVDPTLYRLLQEFCRESCKIS